MTAVLYLLFVFSEIGQSQFTGRRTLMLLLDRCDYKDQGGHEVRQHVEKVL